MLGEPAPGAASLGAGGLRAAAYASTTAAPIMVAAGRGLIVSMTRVPDRPHGHAFDAVAKNATNELTDQSAHDLRPHSVACAAVSPARRCRPASYGSSAWT